MGISYFFAISFMFSPFVLFFICACEGFCSHLSAVRSNDWNGFPSVLFISLYLFHSFVPGCVYLAVRWFYLWKPYLNLLSTPSIPSLTYSFCPVFFWYKKIPITPMREYCPLTPHHHLCRGPTASMSGPKLRSHHVWMVLGVCLAPLSPSFQPLIGGFALMAPLSHTRSS